ncbi:MAG: MerR family transcriptional regulator [Tissierellales bacterium]|nr:MerR family transcriptional regulator [Tissierellales bacterium]MBN2827330.1 MerR family transcriptional regulator [Tissierellales bacterium]
MKIGQFARKNNTSIDTIRHYISLGLLMPEKRKAQYEFDENCTRDFQEILQLKQIGFTLSEIQQLILYRRIGKLTEYDTRMTYTSFFKNKKKHIECEINKLNEMKGKLDRALEEMQMKQNQNQNSNENRIGISLNSLELFSCPLCHDSFKIVEGSIKEDVLMNATLKCSCDYQIRIIDGIVFTPELIGEYENVKDANISEYSESYIDDYINTTHLDYLNKLLSGLQWASRHISSVSLDESVVLELGSGQGYYLRHMLDRFPESCTYIAVDHNPIKMMWLKKIIERSRPRCKILFVCADFTKLPIKPCSIDVLFDISGSSNYSFTHTEFLLYEIDYLLKQKTYLLGYYILFENFVSNSKIPALFRPGFRLQQIQSHLKTLQYACMDELISEPVEKGGPLEDYFVEGERVRTYFFSGMKSKNH